MSLTQRLVESLTAHIQEGVIRPGERLPTENSMVETYGVSRTVVREAISRLQAAGLIETHQGRGSFVLARPSSTTFAPDRSAGLTLPDALDLLAFRTAFEVEAAGIAAARRSEPRLRALREALDDFAGCAGNPGAAVAADFRFHLRIALATENRYFADLLKSLGAAMIVVPRDRLLPGREEHFATIVAEHENIHAAIERQDAEGARAAARVHLGNSQARLLSAHATTTDGSPGEATDKSTDAISRATDKAGDGGEAGDGREGGDGGGGREGARGSSGRARGGSPKRPRSSGTGEQRGAAV
ncbi:FadR/GntR family transcriptional regulator [Streptosporangium sp. KLBMP 9127]|nr:FadR family transcriptional regulator [Streptosporangium sp. KLBMP 9127]